MDDIGRAISVPRRPARIVSLVPSLTDLCFALGAGQRVVGITDFCVEPAGKLDGITRVGGEKRPSIDVIRGLAPDLVLANKEENRRQDVDRLADSGIPVHVSYPRTVAEGAKLCVDVADLLSAGSRGVALAARIRKASAEARRAGIREADGVPAVVLIWKDPMMTISGDTYGHDVLACLGGRNLYAQSIQRYPKVTLSAIARLAPRLILLPDEPYDFTAEDAAEVGRAVPGAVVVRCPGRAFFWHGPRAVEISALARLVADAFTSTDRGARQGPR